MIADLATRQHGIVALWQLRELGHIAAVLACGRGAVLSHRSAAALLGLRSCSRTAVDVSAARRTGRERRGIDVHSGATLSSCDVMTVDAIACTTVARTLLDLAEVVNARAVERAFDQAEVLRVLDVNPIQELLARSRGRRGASVLRAVLTEHRAGSTLTRNELEERFLAICRGTGRPPDDVNAWIPHPDGGGAEGDFVWRAQRLIVEVDGRDVHTTRRAFESDRRRDQRLLLLGWRVVRFTWRQVQFEQKYVAATLRALLDCGSAPAIG